MPTILYSTLQSRVQTRVIDLPTAVQAEIPTLINDAIHFLCAQHNFKVMEAQTSYITTAAAHIIGQIPSDWKEQRDNSYYISNVGWTKELAWQPSRLYINRRWAPADPNQIGPPRDIFLGESEIDTAPDPGNPDQDMSQLNIEIFPFPDGQSDWPDGQYRIRIPYWRYLPDLSAGTDHNWFTDWCDRFIVDYASADAFMLDWDEARAGLWMAKAVGPKWDGFTYNTLGGWARQAINRDSSFRFAPGKTLVPRRDVNAPRDQWRQ
jgi:hypothetical protein